MSRLQIWLIRLMYMPIPGLARCLIRFFPTGPEVTGQLDWLAVQAIGRNSYPDDGLATRLNGLREQSDDDLSLFQALEADGFNPGITNRELASFCQAARYINSDIVLELQWEVAFALWQDLPSTYRANAERVTVAWPSGTYFNTRMVKTIAVTDLKRRGLALNRGGEVSWINHVVRGQMILWRLGASPTMLPVVCALPGERSVQWWTRGSLRWWLQEARVRPHHVLHRWVRFGPPTF